MFSIRTHTKCTLKNERKKKVGNEQKMESKYIEGKKISANVKLPDIRCVCCAVCIRHGHTMQCVLYALCQVILLYKRCTVAKLHINFVCVCVCLFCCFNENILPSVVAAASVRTTMQNRCQDFISHEPTASCRLTSHDSKIIRENFKRIFDGVVSSGTSVISCQVKRAQLPHTIAYVLI